MTTKLRRSQNVDNKPDSTSTTDRGLASSSVVGSQVESKAEHRLNSRDRPSSSGPESDHQFPKADKHPKQRNHKKSNILTKLFSSCFPFFSKKNQKKEEVVKPIENKHILRVKYGLENKSSLKRTVRKSSSQRQSYRFERNERKIHILREKGFRPKKVDGVVRYIKTEKSRHFSLKHIKCLLLRRDSNKVNERIRLMPQNGRDDSHRKKVHKPIRLMGSGPKRVEVKPIVWKDLNGIEGEPEIKALDFFVKSKSFTNKSKPKNIEVRAHNSVPKTVEVTKITVDKVSANEDSCQDKQLSKASDSVLASEELADKPEAKSEAVNNSTINCDEALNNKQKEENIGINSVAAENNITSPPPPKDRVQQSADRAPENTAENLKHYICFNDFIENEYISQKIFEKLGEKTPNSMKKEISEKLVEMVDTFKDNDILIGNFLGMGGFGFVFEGLMRGQRIALKFNSRKEEKHRTDFLKESTILSELKHNNVLRFIELKRKDSQLIATECADCDLTHLINSNLTSKEFLDFETIRLLSKQIISGVEYMHKEWWAHLDIKVDNILIVKSVVNHSEVITAKVADLGMAKQCTDIFGRPVSQKITCGTPTYWSPEVLLGKCVKDISKPDVWAIGNIVYILVAFRPPFPSYRTREDPDKSIAKERAKFFKEEIDSIYGKLSNHRPIDDMGYKEAIDEIIKVIKRLLNPIETQRESLTDILEDHWFTSTERRPEFYYKKCPILKKKRVKRNHN